MKKLSSEVQDVAHEHSFSGAEGGYRCACGVVRPDRDDVPNAAFRRHGVQRCVNEEQNSDSGEMQQTAPCHPQTAIPKDISESAEDALRKAANQAFREFDPGTATYSLALRVMEYLSDREGWDERMAHVLETSKEEWQRAVVIPEPISLTLAEIRDLRVRLDDCSHIREAAIEKAAMQIENTYGMGRLERSHIVGLIRDSLSNPITQAGASASALSTTVPDLSPASPTLFRCECGISYLTEDEARECHASESESLVTVDEAALRAAEKWFESVEEPFDHPRHKRSLDDAKKRLAEIIATELSVHQPDVQATDWDEESNGIVTAWFLSLPLGDIDATARKNLANSIAALARRAASPVQPEVWVTCADCGQKRPMSSLESRDTFVCRYCLSTKPVQVDEVSNLHLCVVCHVNGVSPEEGFDTCTDCAKRI